MSVKVGDLVVTRVSTMGVSPMKGIVYDVSDSWVYIMWANGQQTARHFMSLEVVSEP